MKPAELKALLSGGWELQCETNEHLISIVYDKDKPVFRASIFNRGGVDQQYESKSLKTVIATSLAITALES